MHPGLLVSLVIQSSRQVNSICLKKKKSSRTKLRFGLFAVRKIMEGEGKRKKK